jgi:hypothetical protein
LCILSLEGPPLLRTKPHHLSKRYAQLPALSLLLPCFRPVANFCTSDQFRQLHNPIKINRDRQSAASFPHRFRSTAQPIFGLLLRFSTPLRFPSQPSTLLTQKSQFVAPLFSWSYKLLFPQFLSFDKHLRCPPGVGVGLQFSRHSSSAVTPTNSFRCHTCKSDARKSFPCHTSKKARGCHDYC